MFIATDQDGTKWLFEKKPERKKNCWANSGKLQKLGEFPFNELPSFVQQQEWKDAPLQIKFEIKKK
jgi:hypothetical protein